MLISKQNNWRNLIRISFLTLFLVSILPFYFLESLEIPNKSERHVTVGKPTFSVTKRGSFLEVNNKKFSCGFDTYSSHDCFSRDEKTYIEGQEISVESFDATVFLFLHREIVIQVEMDGEYLIQEQETKAAIELRKRHIAQNVATSFFIFLVILIIYEVAVRIEKKRGEL